MNLNQCLPSQDRITKKMPKASIEKHEKLILISTIKRYLDKHDSGILSTDATMKSMTRMFTLLQKPRYFDLIKKHTGFRNCMVQKIRDLVEELINLRTQVELGLRLKLASELKKLRNKIDTSGPYQDHSQLANVVPLSFQ